MLPDETQHPDENVENEDTTTQGGTRESEDASEDFESLFGDDSQEDAPVTREEFNRLTKGIKKIASQMGRQKVEKQPETKETVSDNEDATIVYFENKPEAALVDDALKTVADKLYGGSKIKAWKNETWLQEKAKAMAEAKAEEERNKAKVEKPSTQTDSSPEDISKVKAEDVEKLSPAEKIAWIKEQARREKMRAD